MAYTDPAENGGMTRAERLRAEREGGRGRNPDTGFPIDGPMSLAEIEERILDAERELEEASNRTNDLADRAAAAEADWKLHRDTVLVELADSGDKEAADIREARARIRRVDPTDPNSPTGADLERLYKILSAQERSAARYQTSLQSRLMALLSVAKGIRGNTQ